MNLSKCQICLSDGNGWRMTIMKNTTHAGTSVPVSYAAGMWVCCAKCQHQCCTCPCLWGWLAGWTAAVGVWGAAWPDIMTSVLLTGGCSSTRKATSPQTRQWAPSSAKWKEWATPTWTEQRESGMWPTTSSLHRLAPGWLMPSTHEGTCVHHMTPDWSVICFAPLVKVTDHCQDYGKSGSDSHAMKSTSTVRGSNCQSE